jgi:filamentous hemagglutinin
MCLLPILKKNLLLTLYKRLTVFLAFKRICLLGYLSLGIVSLNEGMRIEAKEVVIENLKDHDNGKDYNIGLGGIDKKNAIPQTELQYSSHDKEQDTNATFVNTGVIENGQEINLEEKGINTDIDKAQVITKDDVIE